MPADTKESPAFAKFVEFGKRYGPNSPLGELAGETFVEEVLGIQPDDWQREVLRAFSRGERGISVASCHGPGKTATAAWTVWIMLTTRYPQKTVATAPTSAQLNDALFAEVIKWRNRLPEDLAQQFEYKSNRIHLRAAPEESFFSARTSRAESPEALQGVHSDNVLLIGDEASGIPEPVFQAAMGSMAGPRRQMFLISNPVRTSGTFFDTHHRLKDRWFTMRVSYKDSTRVPDQFAEDIAKQHGEDSNVFRIRCLGLFPKSDDDTVIPYGLVVAAQERDIAVSDRRKRIWGVDVARFGDDKCAIVERSERFAQPLDMWGHQDLMQTAGRVKRRWDDTPPHDRPGVILVDVIGLGAGVVDRLREQGLPVRGVNVAESAVEDMKFVNKRAELWWAGREWFEKKDTRLARPDPKADPRTDYAALLADELVVPRYEIASNGKIRIESKADMKKRGHKSPNLADAFIITFAENLAILTHGRDGWGSTWGESIERGLSG